MNFKRRSPCEDLLFAIVLLLPPVFAGTHYVESDGRLFRISQARSEATSVAARTLAVERWIVRSRWRHRWYGAPTVG